MNLTCPHCKKTISIADDLAGKTSNCPECGGPFTVPTLQPPVAAGSSEPIIPFRAEAAAPPLGAAPAPPPPPPFPAAAPPPVGDYTCRCACTLNPTIVRWTPLVCLALIFVIMLLPFMPWVGIYYGPKMIARQSGAGVAFGGQTEYKEKALEEFTKQYALGELDDQGKPKDPINPGVGVITLLYFILLILTVVAAAGAQLLPLLNPSLAQKLNPWTQLTTVGLGFLLFLFIVLQAIFSFPLENQLRNRVKDASAKEIKRIQDDPNRPDQQKQQQIERIQEGAAWLETLVQRRFGLWLVLLLNLVAFAAALTDMWLRRRIGKPPPRLVVEC